MEKIQAVKGMNDVLAPDVAKWHFIEARARRLFEGFGYREIRTPIVEYTPLFARGIGEATDIVEKEMYTFEDRDGRSLSMRPEGTASAVRAYVEHNQSEKEPVTRWYYSGPMFRHERAQRGRYRQFYQMGCEVFGIAEPSLDAEVIAMVAALFEKLGIAPVDLRVSSVGVPAQRGPYRAALVEYFRGYQAELCADCQRRLETNPLRILDCKQPRCVEIAQGAPSILDHLDAASRAHFDAALAALDRLGVAYKIDPRIVRGLDYYTGTVFEVSSASDALGAQNTLLAGGRYDQLVESLGGPKTPAVGFAFGVERMVLSLPELTQAYQRGMDLFLVSHGEEARAVVFELAHTLRLSGYAVELAHGSQSFKAQMRRADRLGAQLVLLLGEAELQAGTIKVRNMQSGQESTLEKGLVLEELRRLLAPTASPNKWDS